MADDQQQDATYWIKETQRRGIELTKAQELGASADEIAKLQARLDEADRQRQADASR